MFSELASAVATILTRELHSEGARAEFVVPSEPSHGDATTAVALALSRTLKRPPREIASRIVEELRKLSSVARADVAGAGYVNVWLTPEALLKELSRSREAATARVMQKKARPVIVEYSQPNIAKPLGAHHILSTVIGQSLSNLYRHLGFPTVAINHLGDWGTQFGKLTVAIERFGKGKKPKDLGVDGLLKLYVLFHEKAGEEPALEREAQAAFKKLEDGDEHMRQFWQEVVDVSVASIEKLYTRLGVSFDHVHGESFYQDTMTPILEEGKKKNVIREGEGGALIVEFPPESHLPTYLVQKSDGATLYSTRDLATIRYRVDTWHPQAILYVVDVAQQLYFQQLFATVQQLQWDVPHLEHVIFGRMSFADKGMSTRKGNILKLEEVLDEAVRRAEKIIAERGDAIQSDDPKDLAEMMGIGAVAYGILSQNRKQDIVFDWDKMLSFEGNSAPYLQYTHARARSVLRKAEAEECPLPENVDALTEKERVLIRMLLQFRSVLDDARENNMPHKIANYLFALCQDYNAFYNTDPILKAEGAERALRIALTALTADILRAGAGILTLRLPDRM